MEKCKVNPDKWKIYQYDELLGSFDAVVIAHNGKCADRLLSTTGDRTSSISKVTRNNISHCSIFSAEIDFWCLMEEKI